MGRAPVLGQPLVRSISTRSSWNACGGSHACGGNPAQVNSVVLLSVLMSFGYEKHTEGMHDLGPPVHEDVAAEVEEVV